MRTIRAALLIGTCAASWTGAIAQTVAIPAGEAPTAAEIGKPGTMSGAQASPLSDATAAPAPAGDPGDIVVTGTRIVANGYQAPTPVTVVSATELLRKAPESLAAGLAQLPQFVGTAGSNVTSSQAGTPSAGNYLNLRRLGQKETLLLLDGQRLPPTSFDGSTDANIIPQSLVQRVDVVTGGASAAYGSDAVAGVVNFVIDPAFKGLKASAQYGLSSRGDDHQEKVSIAYGANLTERLHFELGLDYFYQPGLATNDSRPYGGNFTGGYVNVGANAARPCAAGVCADNAFTPVFNVRLANGTYGTLINSARNAAGATVPFTLNLYTFEPTLSGGPVSAFGAHKADLGTPTGTPNFNIGGADTAVTFGTTLTSLLRTKQGFGRLDYDFGGDIHGFVQGSYTDSDTYYVTVGAGTQFQSFQIFNDNAFLPAAVRNQMIAEGVTSFVASRVEADQDPKKVFTNNQAETALVGLRGPLGKFKWNLNYSHGNSILNTQHFGNFFQQRWFAALDAVRDPNNNIVCRVTLTNPGLYPGCVPWNPFGNGSPSKASYDYFQSVPSTYRIRQAQDAFAANVTGPLFDLPAGAVNIAVGAEYRLQLLRQTSNNDPSKPIDLTGLRTNANPYNLTFNSTNVGKTFGQQTIKEGFGEIAIPIFRDKPFFHALDLNGAVRYTDYSVSGGIWSWKGGVSWSPVEELRLRATLSRDIRAPNLYELFAGVSSTRGTFTDIHTTLDPTGKVITGVNTNLITLTQGNPLLKPETARTLTAGAIFQPHFFPGFSISVDYFRIELKNQISSLSTTDLNQRCEDSGGTDPLCAFIVRPFPFANRDAANFPSTISTVPFNQASLVTEGIDYEINYRFAIGTGQMGLRVLGNYTPVLTTRTSDAANVIPVLNAGVAGSGVPRHKITGSIDYSISGLHLGADVRYLDAMFYTRQANVFVANNRLPPVAYLNANISYDFDIGNKRTVTLYASGTNLTDHFVFAPQNNAQPTEFYPSFQSQYDVVGRYFVVGARVRL